MKKRKAPVYTGRSVARVKDGPRSSYKSCSVEWDQHGHTEECVDTEQNPEESRQSRDALPARRSSRDAVLSPLTVDATRCRFLGWAVFRFCLVLRSRPAITVGFGEYPSA